VIRGLSGQPTVSVVALASAVDFAKRVRELERSLAYPVHEVSLAEIGEGGEGAASGSVGGTPAEAANLAAGKATGEYLLFLRDCVGAPSPEWLVQLLRQAQRTEAGAAGGRVIDGDGNARYAGGFFQELGKLVGSSAGALPQEQASRYLPIVDHQFNPHVVCADCMMVRRAVFEEMGGFDEKNLPKVFYDLDFSFRLGEKGLMNVYVPEATVVSGTGRPQPDAQEIRRMWERWWPMLVKTLYYRDSPLRTAEKIPDGDLLSLVYAS
jgi:GT2 family glycosyltransferase